ncbi:Asparagine synthase (glutamine-hydrolyzing) [Halorhabdus sp. SVX81]|nr:Asparagine synthase (glutamine-hydrolyzing) [Halorhabdus sp. SVX81]
MSAIDGLEQFRDLLASVGGYFSLIVEKEQTVYAVTDHLNSKPLYFGESEQGPFISDDVPWMSDLFDISDSSEIAEVEHLTNRAIMNGQTRYPGIKRLPAGSLLVARSDDNSSQFQVEQYYQPRTPTDIAIERKDVGTVIDDFTTKVQAAFQELIKYADGRQLVVPLSSGNDATLVALMLRRLGYDNVVCFTANNCGNEVEPAERIANEIGYPWYSTDETHSDWRTLYESGALDEYYQTVGLISGDNPAFKYVQIKKLVERGVIADDAIFVPGHTANDVGRAIPPTFTEEGNVGEDEFRSAIKRDNLWLYAAEVHSQALRRRLLDRVLAGLGYSGGELTSAQAINLYEDFRWDLYQNWVWNESLIDYLGFEWRCPLLNKNLVEFWTETHPRWKRDQYAYKKYVKNLYEEETGSTKPQRSDTNPSGYFNKMKKLLKSTPLERILRELRYRRQWREYYDSDPRHGVLGEDRFYDWGMRPGFFAQYIRLHRLGRVPIDSTSKDPSRLNDEFTYAFNQRGRLRIKNE